MKWHKNHTICSNCHQQKSRGASCPVCKKAYKLSNVKGMTICTVCKKYVHNTCDKDVIDKGGEYFILRKMARPGNLNMSWYFICYQLNETSLINKPSKSCFHSGLASV